MWATKAVQSRNKHTNVNLTFDGRTMCLLDWSREVGIAPVNLKKRLNKGWSVEDVLTRPKGWTPPPGPQGSLNL